MNHYTVLGVAEDASSEAIHNAFRALARQYHPDAGEGSSAGKFRELVDAYNTLSDPARRKDYDAAVARQRPPAPLPRYTPSHVVVEPLAQPWFASRPQSTYSRPLHFSSPGIADDWFDQLFQSLEEFLSDPWFYSR